MDDSLEALLEKATNPKNRYEDWEFIMSFCDKVNSEPEGPQTALRIMVPKLRHENEKVAMLALALLEACVKNCGRKFHQELGKFRFLNELIRMISPKYLGSQTSEKVKEKIQELLYSWKVGLPNETKITEAFEMLKKQGLVFDETVPPDPTLGDSTPPKPRVQLQEDPRHSQMLGKLLKSKNAEDLRAANRLIRDMVRRDEKRMEKLKKRLDDLELINNNIKLLNEMLSHYKEDSADHEKLIIEELHSAVEKMRPQLFKMASDLQPNEEGMTEILQTNDSLIRALDHYKRIVKPKGEGMEQSNLQTPTSEASLPVPAGATPSEIPTNKKPDSPSGADLLLDLADLNFGTPTLPISNGTTSINTAGSGDGSVTMATGLLGDLNLLDIPSSLSPSLPTANLGISSLPSFTSPNSVSLSMAPSSFVGQSSVQTGQTSVQSGQTGFPDVDLLGGFSPIPASVKPEEPTVPDPFTGKDPFALPTPFTASDPFSAPAPDPFTILGTLNVPLDSLKPTSDPPLQLLNKNGITCSLYFTEGSPSPGIIAMVVTLLSANPKPISNVMFQAAVPKVMKCKLLPPTRTELAGFNPLVPLANISQVLLLANPTKAEVRLKFRVSYIPLGEQEIVEVGEASKIPIS